MVDKFINPISNMATGQFHLLGDFPFAQSSTMQPQRFLFLFVRNPTGGFSNAKVCLQTKTFDDGIYRSLTLANYLRNRMSRMALHMQRFNMIPVQLRSICPHFSRVVVAMVRWVGYFEIFKTIVVANMVLVVNLFMWLKHSSKVLLHYQTMFKYSSTLIRDNSIPLFIQKSTAIPWVILAYHIPIATRLAAKMVFCFRQSPRVFLNRFLASMAVDNNLCPFGVVSHG